LDYGASAFGATNATIAPTSIVFAFLARISRSVPADDSALRRQLCRLNFEQRLVFSILSPTASAFETVPSVIDSPICGITTSLRLPSKQLQFEYFAPP
jgi:hypothetical protein